MEEYREKVRRLRAVIKSYAGEDIAVAFSGGADSGLLLKLANEAARETGRKVYGISVSDKPASPCLATRFPYGTRLDRAELLKVGRAEAVLREMGFYNVRVRVHGNLARIETDAENIPLLMERRESIVGAVKRLGYDYVAADLEGFRSGSMDIHLKAHEAER